MSMLDGDFSKLVARFSIVVFLCCNLADTLMCEVWILMMGNVRGSRDALVRDA